MCSFGYIKLCETHRDQVVAEARSKGFAGKALKFDSAGFETEINCLERPLPSTCPFCRHSADLVVEGCFGIPVVRMVRRIEPVISAKF
jgi:hypothetical protein